MRIGILARGEASELERAASMGFRSIEWIAFAESRSGADSADWKQHADQIGSGAKARNIRISAIGALYTNPLDPQQSDYARSVFRRAIEVAAHLEIRTVAGFPGAFIETEIHKRGGNVVYKPFENYLPQLISFWEPIAQFAADNGIRIAFEHCPQGAYHLPVMGYNMLGQPAMWERLFNECKCENIGIEWDASHLICQLIDPVLNIHKFGSRIFHVHAKDAYINTDLLRTYGICHHGVAEHRMPGLGQANWAEIIHALLRAGYDSDLNIEGWHDPIFRDHDRPSSSHKVSGTDALAGRKLEDAGLLIAKRTLEHYAAGLA